MKYTKIIVATITIVLAVVAAVLSVVSIITPSTNARFAAYSYNEQTGFVTLPALLVARSCPVFGCRPSVVTACPPVYLPVTVPDITLGTCASIQQRRIPCRQPFARIAVGYMAVAVPFTIVAASHFVSTPPPSRCISIPQCPGILVNSSTCEHAFHNPVSTIYGFGNTSIRCTANQELLYNTSMPCIALRKCPVPLAATTTTTTTTATITTASRIQTETTTAAATTTTTTTTATTQRSPIFTNLLYGTSCPLSEAGATEMWIPPGYIGMFVETTTLPGYPFDATYYVTDTDAYVVVNGNIVEASAFSLADRTSACVQIPPEYIANTLLYTQIWSP